MSGELFITFDVRRIMIACHEEIRGSVEKNFFPQFTLEIKSNVAHLAISCSALMAALHFEGVIKCYSCS